MQSGNITPTEANIMQGQITKIRFFTLQTSTKFIFTERSLTGIVYTNQSCSENSF